MRGGGNTATCAARQPKWPDQWFAEFAHPGPAPATPAADLDPDRLIQARTELTQLRAGSFENLVKSHDLESIRPPMAKQRRS
jgi:hypothetical protein